MCVVGLLESNSKRDVVIALESTLPYSLTQRTCIAFARYITLLGW